MKKRGSVYVRAMAIVMLFAMFHYVAGYRLLYSLGILFAKEKAQECMVDKKDRDAMHCVSTITLSASDYNSLKWAENNKEFTFNGIMYDVESIQKYGNNYIVSVYQDTQETQWVGSYHDFEKQIYQSDQSSKGTKSAEEILSVFQKEFIPVSEFKLYPTFNTPPSTFSIFKQHLTLLTDNIFHPPVNC